MRSIAVRGWSRVMPALCVGFFLAFSGLYGRFLSECKKKTRLRLRVRENHRFSAFFHVILLQQGIRRKEDVILKTV